MLRAVLAAGVLCVVAAVGCTSQRPGSPQDTTIKVLTVKLESAMSCDAPQHSDKDTSVRVNCDGGKAFITAYPDAASVRAEFARLADVSTGNDYLVGDDGTWFAGANDLDGLQEMRTYLGGRIQHVVAPSVR